MLQTKNKSGSNNQANFNEIEKGEKSANWGKMTVIEISKINAGH